MNIVGKSVTHKKLGEGIVIGLCDEKMEVDFKTSVKKFVFPDSFEEYFTISDKNAENYINGKLEVIRNQKRLAQEQKTKEDELKLYKQTLKIKPNSQAVFGMKENDLSQVLEQWEVFTGYYASGEKKGTARIAKNLNVNTACLLTVKKDGWSEKERVIAGIFMVKEDFIGENCENGIIKAHEDYRIAWDYFNEEIYLWDYFPEDKRLKSWGVSEMKYIPNVIIKQMLIDMIEMSEKEKQKAELEAFLNYFCELNHI